MRAKSLKTSLLAATLAAAAGCGGGDFNEGNNGSLGEPTATNNFGNNDSVNNAASGGDATNNSFVPEVEEFLIRSVAATDSFVFVPNSSEEGTSVARIDGRDFSVTPIPVGLHPTDVVALEHPTAGAVAVVLVEGTSSAAVIRAEGSVDDPADRVTLLPVPAEVNRLVASPDGTRVLAWIDPDAPLPEGSTVASLQSAALIEIGAQKADDASYELSVTRLIRDIEFTESGDALFIVGREGVNRLDVESVTANAFVPPLPLQLSPDVFPPTDLEVEVAADGSFLVVRSSAFAGVALYTWADGTLSEPRVLELPDIPTDIDLHVTATERTVLATVRDASVFSLIDVDAAIADAAYVAPLVAVSGANAGLAELTADRSRALLYSTLPALPTLAVYGFEDATLRTYPLRNRIRSISTAPDSRTAVVIHQRIDPKDEPQVSFFQQQHGLTLFDIETGYRRPIVLQGEPTDLILAPTGTGGYAVFVLLESDTEARQGVMKIDLATYRTDFVPVAREPRQIGLVAGKIFVAQEADDGRITFFDVDTLAQRTVSGYELNAGID